MGGWGFVFINYLLSCLIFVFTIYFNNKWTFNLLYIKFNYWAVLHLYDHDHLDNDHFHRVDDHHHVYDFYVFSRDDQNNVHILHHPLKNFHQKLQAFYKCSNLKCGKWYFIRYLLDLILKSLTYTSISFCPCVHYRLYLLAKLLSCHFLAFSSVILRQVGTKKKTLELLKKFVIKWTWLWVK